jgi:hypothetical protein
MSGIRLRGGVIFWLIVVVLLYMAYKAPTTLSALIGSILHLFATIGNGFVQFLNHLGIG